MWKVKYIPEPSEYKGIALVRMFKDEATATAFAKSLGKRLISITSIT